MYMFEWKHHFIIVTNRCCSNMAAGIELDSIYIRIEDDQMKTKPLLI